MNRRQLQAQSERNYYERQWALFEARERARLNRAEKRELFDQLSAAQLLQLADDLGVRLPKTNPRTGRPTGATLTELLERKLGI